MMVKEKENLQLQSYKLMRKAVSTNPITHSLIRNRRWLDKQDIIHEIYTYFLERDSVSKFDPTKGALSSYIYKFVRWQLNTLLRHKDNPEITFSDLEYKGDDGEWKEFEVPDFNTGESLLLDKTKEKDIKNLRAYIFGENK
jgi:hypothetical protein